MKALAVLNAGSSSLKFSLYSFAGQAPGLLAHGQAAVVAERERAVRLAQERYRVGSGDLRAVSQEELALFSARTALIQLRAEQLVQRASLYLALGGDFGATPESSPPKVAQRQP